MTSANFKLLAIIGLSTCVAGCDKEPQPQRSHETKTEIEQQVFTDSQKELPVISEPAVTGPVDPAATQALNDKLLGTLEGISSDQTNLEEGISKQALEQLSEADRQAFIDMTIESSSKQVSEDADEVLKGLNPE